MKEINELIKPLHLTVNFPLDEFSSSTNRLSQLVNNFFEEAKIRKCNVQGNRNVSLIF